MRGMRAARVVRYAAAAVAVAFGTATVFSGGRVLLGADAGYVVFLPLLVYNTAMGLAYLAAGVALVRSAALGRLAAGAIFGLNLVVLVGIVVLYTLGAAVAPDSLEAMSVRTGVWLALFAAAWWAARSRPAANGRR